MGDDHHQKAAETKRQRTREKLITAALDVFSAKPWAEARVEDVAKLAGVSAPTAYNHYKTKDDLMAAVSERFMQPLMDKAIADIDAERDSTEAITRHVRDLTKMANDNLRLTANLVRAAGSMFATFDEDNDQGWYTLLHLSRPLVRLLTYHREGSEWTPTLSVWARERQEKLDKLIAEGIEPKIARREADGGGWLWSPAGVQDGIFFTHGLLIQILFWPKHKIALDYVLARLLPVLKETPRAPAAND